MSTKYQLSAADGTPDWSAGRETFAPLWLRGRDLLRFHRGAGFTIKQGHSPEGPIQPLVSIPDHLAPRLTSNPEDVFRVRSVQDDYTLLFRYHEITTGKGDQVVEAAAKREGTPYIFGVTDCSWLSGSCVEDASGIVLPHNAHAQRLDPRVKSIPESKLKPGDLVFIHDDDHVAIWVGKLPGYPGNVVWDTEPSNTSSPAGWPTSTLGTGVQIRPAYQPWYCGAINARGRIEAINGAA